MVYNKAKETLNKTKLPRSNKRARAFDFVMLRFIQRVLGTGKSAGKPRYFPANISAILQEVIP